MNNVHKRTHLAGAGQPTGAGHETGSEEGEESCGDEGTDESLPRLLGADADEGRAAKEEACV